METTDCIEVEKIMKKVSKRTRTRKGLRDIYCPHCMERHTVGHFSWSAIKCQNCKRYVGKEKWGLKNE